ncbi:unnamed protein product [Protopolystoma xenopodis]|uniref:Phosphatidate cytidylyltransferase n=1 Tax=Protopolystoma xenopodis TaxID=117903 RepID=A0A3S5B7A7_9PLAT|nr:unnamed protein product [Protopolystoma xenopodis]
MQLVDGDTPALVAGNAEDNDTVASPNLEATKNLGQGTDTTPSLMRGLINSLPPRWANWVVRSFTTFLLISVFSIVIYMGPLALVLLVATLGRLSIFSVTYKNLRFGESSQL